MTALIAVPAVPVAPACRMRWRAGATLALSLAVACRADAPASQSDAQMMAFDSAVVRLAGPADTMRLRVQLAVTDDQKTMGLMERTALADDAGMLFVYDSTQPPDAGFWMFRTRIPLDIAFLDSAGTIRAVRTMTPCTATIAQGCPTYAPEVPYRYALEVNGGWFARRGVGAGHTVLLRDLPQPPSAPPSPD